MKQQSWLFASLFGAAALLAHPLAWSAEIDFSDIRTEIAAQRDEGVQRLQEWIRVPSIAAMDIGYPEGPDLLISRKWFVQVVVPPTQL